MITWPLSPIPPPPIARRSTPRRASSSARDAIEPGSFFSWTTNWLAIDLAPRDGQWDHDSDTALPPRPATPHRRRGAQRANRKVRVANAVLLNRFTRPGPPAIIART